jgi:hypothetical protein
MAHGPVGQVLLVEMLAIPPHVVRLNELEIEVPHERAEVVSNSRCGEYHVLRAPCGFNVDGDPFRCGFGDSDQGNLGGVPAASRRPSLWCLPAGQ